MPEALLPKDPITGEIGSMITLKEGLSSKNHWDVPIEIDGNIPFAL